MAYVVCEPCRDCKYTDCVVVCPDECFYQDESMLYIDPDNCIDCGACVPECPVEAIFAEDGVPEQWRSYVRRNRDRTRELIALGTARMLEKQEPKVGEACGGPR